MAQTSERPNSPRLEGPEQPTTAAIPASPPPSSRNILETVAGTPATVETRERTIEARDGFQLAATLVSPPAGTAVRGRVLINPATAVKRGYYLRYAQFLAENGFLVLTFDYRGIGGSRPDKLRGFEATMQQWAQLDSAAALDWLEAILSELPLILVGHSFGGQALGLLPAGGRLQAVVTVAAQSGYWRHWPGFYGWGMWWTWHVLIPALTGIWGYLPAKRLGLFEDLPTGVAREWARWGRHPEYILRDEQHRQGYRDFDRPVLAFSFSDDLYAPKAAVRALQAALPKALITDRHREPDDYGVQAIGHFGFFRERFRESLWQESLDWLTKIRAGGIPA